MLVISCLALAVSAVAAQSTNSTSSTGSTSSTSSTSLSTTSGTLTVNSSSTTTTASLSNSTTFSFSLQASNPTAVPLASIQSNGVIPSPPTEALSSTPAPGSTPTDIPNAPALPNPATLAPSAYPTMDKVPDTNSPEVQQWIQEVQNSGFQIPNLTATVLGGCPANPQAVQEATERCWWTCGGCTRDTDVTTCPQKLQWGLTYDDGPSFYTTQLLDYLDQVNLKSTFFTVGSRVLEFPYIAQAEYMKGHQIAVHTWSHPYMTTLTNEQIIAELGWSRKIIQDVLGVTPNMWRPPFGDIDDRVRNISVAMGLKPVIWTRISPTATFDTGDFNVPGGLDSASEVLQNWDYIKGNASLIDTGFILLEHDLFPQTVELATGYILPDALANNPKFNITPVASCMNLPMADAYITTNDNKTNPPIPPPNNGSSGGSSGSSGSGQGSSSAVPLASPRFIIIGGFFATFAALLM